MLSLFIVIDVVRILLVPYPHTIHDLMTALACFSSSRCAWTACSTNIPITVLHTVHHCLHMVFFTLLFTLSTTQPISLVPELHAQQLCLSLSYTLSLSSHDVLPLAVHLVHNQPISLAGPPTSCAAGAPPCEVSPCGLKASKTALKSDCHPRSSHTPRTANPSPANARSPGSPGASTARRPEQMVKVNAPSHGHLVATGIRMCQDLDLCLPAEDVRLWSY